MFDGPKFVRSKIMTLLLFSTCMCIAEIPMLLWSWIQWPPPPVVAVVALAAEDVGGGFRRRWDIM